MGFVGIGEGKSILLNVNIGDDGDWSLQRLKKGGGDKKPTPTYIHVFSASNGSLEEDGSADPHTRDEVLIS